MNANSNYYIQAMITSDIESSIEVITPHHSSISKTFKPILNQAEFRNLSQLTRREVNPSK